MSEGPYYYDADAGVTRGPFIPIRTAGPWWADRLNAAYAAGAAAQAEHLRLSTPGEGEQGPGEREASTPSTG